MTKIMLASGMTDGQIDDLANKVRDAARTHRDEIEKDPAQEGLRSENIGIRLFAEFRRIVEEISKRIVHIENRALFTGNDDALARMFKHASRKP